MSFRVDQVEVSERKVEGLGVLSPHELIGHQP